MDYSIGKVEGTSSTVSKLYLVSARCTIKKGHINSGEPGAALTITISLCRKVFFSNFATAEQYNQRAIYLSLKKHNFSA